jgi:hypothetical protein
LLKGMDMPIEQGLDLEWRLAEKLKEFKKTGKS